MLLKLEDYDRDLHGHQDDCDYVITYDDMHEQLAIDLAKSLGYGVFSNRQDIESAYGMSVWYDNTTDSQFFLCHA